jgi:hypothetical protein
MVPNPPQLVHFQRLACAIALNRNLKSSLQSLGTKLESGYLKPCLSRVVSAHDES